MDGGAGVSPSSAPGGRASSGVAEEWTWDDWVGDPDGPRVAAEYLPPLEPPPALATPHVFRLDIQALRALAVVLVLLWHAGLPVLDGGFIGVDIFFVVSGYLITGLLLRERGAEGTVSLRDFYARRMRRLLPAASIVTVATLVASLVLMPSLRLRSIALDGLASTFYVENWRLALQAVDYQASQVATSPFQHYWSLSVEEQFYLAWPLVILLVLRGPAGFFRVGAHRSRLLTVLTLTLVASFAYSLWSSYSAPDPAYFLTVNRVWQFAAGGLLASVESLHGQLQRRRPALALAAVGLAVLVAGAFLLDLSSPYPGVAALVPTLGTVAVLAGGAAAATTTIGRGLTARPIRWVGDLSYSLYLWHWPMLVFAAEVFGPLSVAEGLLVVTAAVVPSVVSERLIERPVRRSPRFAPWRVGLSLGVALMAVTGGFAAVVALRAPTLRAPSDADNPFYAIAAEQDAGAPPAAGAAGGATTDPGGPTTTTAAGGQRSAADPLRGLGAETLLDDAGDPLPDPPIAYEFDQIFPAPGTDYLPPTFACRTAVDAEAIVSDCNVGGGPSSPRLALVGDSHALQWMPIAKSAAITNGWKMDFYLKAACALNAQDAGPSCNGWQAEVRDALLADPPDMVLLAAGDPLLETGGENQARAEGFASAWQPLRDAGIQLVVIADPPRPDKDIKECVFDNPSELVRCSFDRTTALQSGSNLRAATQDGDATLDLNDLICPADPCPAVVGQTVVFRDNNHLSQEYVRTLARPFALRLGEIVQRAQGGAPPA